MIVTSHVHALILLVDAAEDGEQSFDLECVRTRVPSSQGQADRSELSSRPADVGRLGGRRYWQVLASLQAGSWFPAGYRVQGAEGP